MLKLHGDKLLLAVPIVREVGVGPWPWFMVMVLFCLTHHHRHRHRSGGGKVWRKWREAICGEERGAKWRVEEK
jgi:hypothetical protein